MKITLLTPKEIFSSYIKEGINEYAKRLSRYCQLSHLEYISLNDSISLLDNKCFIIWVSQKFDTLSSEKLASTIESLGVGGISSIAFFLVDKTSDITSKLDSTQHSSTTYTNQFSLSKISLSNETALLLLYEQLYRSYRIIHGEPYHK